MDLNGLSDFVAVVTHGGIGAASRATGQPKASLSRRVRLLESELGLRLVERGGRHLRVTEEGLALHARCAELLAELQSIGAGVSDASGSPRGRLRVSVPSAAATPALGELAGRFVRDYPRVALEIVADDRFVDPIDEGYDLVLRANPAPDTRLVGLRLRTDVHVVAAHPSLDMPSASDAPAIVPAVMQKNATDEVWRLVRAETMLTLSLRPVLRLSSIGLVHGAILAGAGVGLMPRRFILADLESGRLVEWGSLPERQVELWALHPSRRLVSQRVRLFIKRLQDLYAAPP